MSALSDKAQAYTELGFAIIPLRGKLPLTAHGSKDASRDREQVQEWWETWPNANVGIATGAISNVLVVDLDGKAGIATWKEHVRANPTPVTLTARTGGGGYHLLFRTGRDLPNSARKRLGEGIDTRGQGGYIVAPPSVHPETGRVYEWVRNVPPAPLPDWIALLLRPPPRSLTPPSIPFGISAYGHKAIEGLIAEIQAEPLGSRNHTLNACAYKLGRLAAAGHFARGDCEEQAVVAGMALGAEERYVRSVFRYGFEAGTKQPAAVSVREPFSPREMAPRGMGPCLL